MFGRLYKLHVPIHHLRLADAYGPVRERPSDGDVSGSFECGMVTRRVIQAFASIGWGWGGAWTGNTKDYMRFSVNGH